VGHLQPKELPEHPGGKKTHCHTTALGAKQQKKKTNTKKKWSLWQSKTHKPKNNESMPKNHEGHKKKKNSGGARSAP